MSNSFKVALKAANKGDIESIIKVADIYYNGDEIIKIDREKALTFFTLGAKQDDQYCKDMAESLRNDGYGRAKEIKKFIKAGKKGDINAIKEVGDFLLYGKAGYKADPKLAFKLFTKGHKNGDMECAYREGECLLKGEGTKVNKQKAFTIFSEVNNSGSIDAKIALANCYRYGDGTQKSLSETFTLAREAVQSNDIRAIKLLAECYYNGIGTPIDKELAFEYYQEGARLGDDECRYCMGYCYSKGIGTNRDDFLAGKSFAGIAVSEKPGDGYYGYANSYLGYCYLKGTGLSSTAGVSIPVNYEKAMYRFTKAASSGNMYSEYTKALMIERGWGVEKDEKTAFNMFKSLSDRNYVPAIIRLIKVYYKGELGQTQDSKEVEKLTDLAIKLGSGKAQCYRGYFEHIGYGTVKKNDQLAFAKMKQASDKGSVDAHYFLGLFLKNGIGCEKNIFQAVELFKKAAELGSSIAKYTLGVMYDKGDLGVTENFNTALSYYYTANEEGCSYATNALANLYLKGKLGTDGERIFKTDYTKAFEYFKDLVNREVIEGYYGYAICLDLGFGCEKNMDTALDYYLKASQEGLGQATYYIGACCEKGHGVPKNYKKAYNYYLKAAEQGFDKAYYKVGHCHEIGYGCKADLRKAMEFYDKAADLGIDKAALAYGRVAAKLEEKKKDVSKKAIDRLKAAAENGNAEAFGYLAKYLYCLNSNANKDIIAEYLKRGIKESASSAYYFDAYCYENGILNHQKDMAKALQYYEFATQFGSIEACDVLINGYSKGKRLGLQKNREEQFKYELRAASLGDSSKFFEVADAFMTGKFRTQNLKEALYWYGKCAILSTDKKEAKKALARFTSYFFDEENKVWLEGKQASKREKEVGKAKQEKDNTEQDKLKKEKKNKDQEGQE